MSSYSEGQIHQLADALETAGWTKDDVTKLGQFDELKELRGVVRLTHKIVEIPLLTLVRTITTSSATPTIGWKSESFKKWFDGVEEGERSPELTLRKLERSSLDAPIITTLGGEEAEVTLADFYAALAEKEARKDFTWLTGYVKDKSGILRAVNGYWRGRIRFWHVYAYSIENPYEWHADDQVLSRN